ncbi:hypothetical protein JCM16303_000691 [Sporobolomyces ruberrimus]
MSAPPHKSWPTLGSIWGHWSDVILAAQLAALRSGFTAVGRYWRSSHPTELSVKCLVQPSTYRTDRCTSRLLQLEAVDSADPSGAWRVNMVCTENLDVRQHGNHSVGIGTSKGFKDPPSKSPKLALGKIYTSWRSLHKLEASLRSSSRREGRYLNAYSQKEAHGTANHDYSYFISCVLSDRCTYYVHFAAHEQDSGIGWKCTKLYPRHSCISTAQPISEGLEKSLSFWPVPRVTGDYILPTNRWINTSDADVSATDKHIGDYPILPVGEDGQAILPILADTKLSNKLTVRDSALMRSLDALSTARRSVLNLKTTLAAAEIVGDDDEMKRIKTGIPAAEKRVRKKERKVAKRRAKVEKLKEKIATDIMERKKLRGEKK